MKVQIFSDLHMEFIERAGRSALEGISILPQADVIVMAGDIHKGASAINFLNNLPGERPIFYVPGNHEYYGQNYDVLYANFKSISGQRQGNVVMLVGGDYFDYRGFRFVGATLWTDFNLLGSAQSQRAMEVAQWSMNDFRLISNGMFSPSLSAQIHLQELQAIKHAMDSSPYPVVVISHHLPSARCVDPQYAGSSLNAAFASEVDGQVLSRAKLWIHGHTHSSVDTEVHGTRVVCNPRGYPQSSTTFENRAYEPLKLVEL